MTDDAAGHLLHNIFAAPQEPGPPHTHTFDPAPPDPDEATAWLRQRIKERKYLAERTVELGNAAEWTELSSGVLMTIAPDAPQDWTDGVWPMGDSSLTRLMEANDPQDTIARCEAELAILDEFAARDADADLMLGPPTLRQQEWTGLRLAVRLLASAYRHYDGYARFWGEPVTHTTTET